VSLILVTITAQVINMICRSLAHVHVLTIMYAVLFKAILPVAVLVINMVVVFKVRRAAINAAANLGVQPHHHQSTSSSSVVPTVMLVATSLIYVLLYSTGDMLGVLAWLLDYSGVRGEASLVVHKTSEVAWPLSYLVFAYNFYIYLITGKTFRSELYKLFCCCLSSCCCSAAAAAV